MGIIHWVETLRQGITSWLGDPLSDPNLSASVTVLVGSSAFLIYRWQKKSLKRDVAKLLVLEIEYAEKICRGANNENGFEGYLRLLPSNSWNENRHLFVGDFTKSEFETLTRFYARAKDVDALMDEFVHQLNNAHLTLPLSPQGIPTAYSPLIRKSDGTNQNIHNRLLNNRNEILNNPISASDVFGKLNRITLNSWQRTIFILGGLNS